MASQISHGYVRTSASMCAFPAKLQYIPVRKQIHTTSVFRVSKKCSEAPKIPHFYTHLQLSNIYIYVRFLFGQLIIQSRMHGNFSLVFSHLPLDVKLFRGTFLPPDALTEHSNLVYLSKVPH